MSAPKKPDTNEAEERPTLRADQLDTVQLPEAEASAKKAAEAAARAKAALNPDMPATGHIP